MWLANPHSILQRGFSLSRAKAVFYSTSLAGGFSSLKFLTKNPNPSPIGKKFGFCCCGAPPGTRTLGPLIKRNQRATIVNFQNCVKSLFLSFHRKFAFCICCILCTCYPLLHPLSSRSGVQKVCKNVQSQNQHLKTGIGFLCNGVKTGLFHPAKGTLYITNLYHTSNVHQQFDSWQGYGQSN